MDMRLKRWFRRSVALGLVAGATASVGACGISTQQEVAMGQQYATEINSQLPIVNDGQVNRYINELGRRIASRGGRQIGYTFFVVNAEQINAFAVPGGYVYVNRGLIERTRNMSELAGVLAHEIAHVEHRHSVDQMEKMQGANLALTLGYALLGRAPTGLENTAINLGGNLYFAKHSRGAENEADGTAVPLLVATGINPSGLTSFFNVLLSDRNRSVSTVEQWFSTHPLTEDRIQHVQDLVNATNTRGLRTDEAAYTSMKTRLRRYPAPPAEYRAR